MKILFRIISYIKYRFRAGNAHGLHSPFVFELYTEEISKNKQYYDFEQIEELRRKLLFSIDYINVKDLGAGNSGHNISKRKIRNIAKSSLSNPKKCELFFKLTNKFQPKTIIELGTSFGISTLYFSFAKSNTQIYTLEGSEETLEIAKAQFSISKRNNITPILGNINANLPTLLNSIESVDIVYFDANHQYGPTLNYFNWCLLKAHEGTIFIFDDIYWSKDMNKAWNEIIQKEEVKLSIDLFELGLVFFRNNQPKQHFTLQF